jgi:subtilisin family serine protease
VHLSRIQPRLIRPALFWATALAAIAMAAIISPSAGASEPTGRYIVIFKDSVAAPAGLARAQTDQREGKLGFVYRHAFKGYAAELPASAVEALRRDPRVQTVAPDRRVEALAQTTPTGIQRTFAAANERLDIDEQDDVRADVDVAVVDSGVDFEHPDLDVVARTDCSNGTELEAACTDNSGTDAKGHGTHVAGTIAAIDNGQGVVGVAPGARIWAVKVLDKFGSGYDSEVAAGVDWAASHAADIEVVNMSLGCQESICPLPATGAAITGAVDDGLVVVVAAGNSWSNASGFAPANHPDVITVSALADFDGAPGSEAGESECREAYEGEIGFQLDDGNAAFSNFGEAVEIAAPGACVLSTLPGGGYGFNSGTSMASPHVAGAAALLAIWDNPSSQSDVEAIRDEIVEAGNFDWTDESPDEITEPLLDVGSDSVFDLKGDPPVNTSLPEIGPSNPMEFTHLWSTAGGWTSKTTISFTHQWQRCNAAGAECVPIGGATKSSYVTGEADVGHKLRLVKTATNQGGSTPVTSAAIGPVQAGAEPHWSDTESGIEVSGTLTVRKGGGSPKTCTPKSGQSAAFGFGLNTVTAYTPFDGYYLWFACPTKYDLRLRFTLYAEATNEVQLTGIAPEASTPWGTSMYQGAEGPAFLDFENGSGETASTMTFEEDELGRLNEGGWPVVTATGTLEVTTAEGGLLTLDD